MPLSKSISDNFRFLIIEVDSQLAKLHRYIAAPEAALARRIFDRSGYAHNLKSRIHRSCRSQLSDCVEHDIIAHKLRAVEFIATELDRIAELCRDCVKQISYVDSWQILADEDCQAMVERLRRGLDLVETAVLESDSNLALKMAQVEAKLDRDYHKLLRFHVAALKQKDNTNDIICSLFVAHSIEQMGDVLLAISESIISANLGQTVNFERFNTLQASMENMDVGEKVNELKIKAIAETRSGSAISAITKADGEDDFLGIFKDGEKRKLKGERKGLDSWNTIYPGLAPKILSYQKRGQSAALLIEHLPGLTFEQIVLNESPALINEALQHLEMTLRSVWQETHSKKVIAANFMQQLAARLPDVYAIHPEFQHSDIQFCGLDIASFNQLLGRAMEFERGLNAPFAVYIHGDFNIDNIIYDPLEQRINFIDLHRSRYTDYVQDISVFMVSNYRLQILDVEHRQRILGVAMAFYESSRRYAVEHQDHSFDLRLTLGLARSFVSSTRFILDKSLARSMFLRARYLLEQLLALDPKQTAGYTLAIKDIFRA
ncbi:MAG: PhoU domain-containing protein [Zhongshania sp.]|uniref:PhoU domain-containing protein n=1 Tax=Zhongshania sp. TaxID=1971902 RepID=UPI002601B9AB|nr:PhoU domain-containing protein [Zhongshania sp.]MDF1692485.1 PhoU domain-containing protein [Zhongshania sp.]